ncbi:MAG TPA: VacB/RNase II family 3'-5' exoribonuclease [Myxococcales bacterium]|nr:VacB/RNase II family 3'-5' exoribonuclease [Myxococcales bacterium]HIK85186.1 VacB/RNase II family 3'-5' exoribonuclease [Myxococcales bacterium]
MAKHSGPGRKSGKQRKPRSVGKPRISRPGTRDHSSPKAGQIRGKVGANVSGQEAIVREIEAPSTSGQHVIAEDRDGQSWRVECLGEPVEVGARISFMPLGSRDGGRASMLRLLDAKRDRWVCTLLRVHGSIRLTPFGGVIAPELILTERDAKQAPDGARVVVTPSERRLEQRGRGAAKSHARGPSRKVAVRVVKILGQPFLPDADHAALVWKHRLPTTFSRRARLEVDAIEERLTAKDFEDRLDLRHLPFITIDPVSARDHDDAVFAEHHSSPALRLVRESSHEGAAASVPSASLWHCRLWVAIADVSHFVSATGWIDAEARRRGNSFYFPDRSIPMLPERLSSDLCSLRAGVDRLVLVAELRMDADGVVLAALFHEAVIRSRVGLSYEEAASWLEENAGSEKVRAKDESSADAVGDSGGEAEWGKSLLCLSEIAEALSRTRYGNGALALELPEVEIEVDAEGMPRDARLRARNPAHLLIEEAMLVANRAVAKALDVSGRPTIHRSHPPPSPQKWSALAVLLEQLGIEVAGDLDQPGVLANVLEQVEGEPSEERIHLAVLRSMSQARYEVESKGHFALRFEHYVHFTSPIRRYADLEVHRALKDLIRGQESSRNDSETHRTQLSRLAIWLSGRERVATEVEREAEALACCALMNGREGESFEASVTGVTEFGLFIRLDSPAVSGLIPVSSLPGFWIYDPDTESVVGEESGRRIGQADRVRIELAEVDANRARLQFRLVGK